MVALAQRVAKAVDWVRMAWGWMWGWMWANVRGHPWDLVRVQAQAEAVVLALARSQAKAKAKEVEAHGSIWRYYLGAPLARELAEVRKATCKWMQVLGQAQVQTWLRVGAFEACKVEVENGLWP